MARAASSPTKGMEVGARVVELQDLNDQREILDPLTGLPTQPSAPARRLMIGLADARYQRSVGQGGLLTGYGELAGSDRQDAGAPSGWAGMGFLRLSHPSLEGTISGRKQSQGFTSLGSDATRFGKLDDEWRVSATGYPVSWLPTTVFYTRQRSWINDGTGVITDNVGYVQHALARLQLNKKGLPMTSVQLGSTILDNQNFHSNRLQAVGQTDYDLAQILSFTGIKRFNVRGLYSVSQAETDKAGTLAYADRVQLSRLEGKLSPTNTESLYTLFRSRLVERQAVQDGSYARSLMHWEMYAGAQSTIIPGLVPKVNYTAAYDDNRIGIQSTSTGTSTSTSTGTGTTGGTPTLAPPSLTAGLTSNVSAFTPTGPGAITLVPPTRSAKASIGGALGIFPGQWWKVMAPAAIEPQLSIANTETTVDKNKTQFDRVYRFDNRAVWAGGGKLELELYQLYQVSLTQQDHHRTAEQTWIRNRILYRPVPHSPITLRLNYQDTRQLNNPELVAGAIDSWADQAIYEGVLEWLMRWNRVVTTRSRLTFNITDTSNMANKDPVTLATTMYGNAQYKTGPEIEWRFFPLQEASALYLYQRDGLFRWFGNGIGAFDQISYYVAAGGIWRVGDKIYLDGGVQYDNVTCLSQPTQGPACSGASRITPRLYLTVNL
jgi:hypothetical protein